MNAAALNVYRALRNNGTQKEVIPQMQTRAELYEFLDYQSFEKKMDALLTKKKGRTKASG